MDTITAGVNVQPSHVEAITRAENNYGIISGSLEQQAAPMVSPKRNAMQYNPVQRDAANRLDNQLGLIVSQTA